MPEGDGGFTLGEAQRQISALWQNVDAIREEIRKVSDTTIQSREAIVSMQQSVNTTNEMLKEYFSSDNVERRAERNYKIQGLNDRITEIEEHPCIHCQHTEIIQKLKSGYRILSWVAGIVGLLTASVAGKILLNVLQNL